MWLKRKNRRKKERMGEKMPDNVNDYLSNGTLFSKLSDITRIVDPLQKTVIQYKNKEVVIDGIHCLFLGQKQSM